MFSALVAEQVTLHKFGGPGDGWEGRVHEFEKAGECPPVNVSRKAGSYWGLDQVYRTEEIISVVGVQWIDPGMMVE